MEPYRRRRESPLTRLFLAHHVQQRRADDRADDFHGARTVPPRAGAGGCHDGTQTGRCFCGASDGAQPSYTEAATLLGHGLAEAGIGLVYGGGGVGVMGSLRFGAVSPGEVIGVIPHALMEREYGRRDLTDLRLVSSMHDRTALMHQLSDAFVVLPGGLGTFEEFFEIPPGRSSDSTRNRLSWWMSRDSSLRWWRCSITHSHQDLSPPTTATW